jgi:AraC-like DNA-binding protein
MPKFLIEKPPDAFHDVGDLLSVALRRIRITGSMQYCFMPSGDWITDATPASYKPADSIGFHLVAAGSCWLDIEGERTVLEEGDIAAFPFGTPHWIGVGSGGPLIDPGGDLPPPPWREIPVLSYGDGDRRVRILCGYIQCEAMNFPSFKSMLPKFIHQRTLKTEPADWLATTIRQIVAEVDSPQRGGASILERLTEVTFIEVLRRQFLREGRSTGWLAAIRDPALGKCLALMHTDPVHEWTIAKLAKASALSRSALSERFVTTLQVSPMRYLRDWRLYLASVQLKLMDKSLAAIAFEAGYGTEAAFNRAFSRRFGRPPAEWRQSARS